MPDIVYNYIITAAVLSWVAAQVIKTVLYLVINRRFRVERLFGAGGMPSAHSAMVCSASVAVALDSGLASTEFAIMVIFSLIVMYDAMGVRRAAGIHAKEINQMKKMFTVKDLLAPEMEEFEGKDKKVTKVTAEQKIKELKEYLGHTPFQVVSGAVLGIIIALILPN